MHVLEAIDVYRFYHTDEDETLALRGVELCVDDGEIVALMGPSGSGKSTLLACLAGLDDPDGGQVLLLGRRFSRRPEAERASLRASSIGILLQRDNLFEPLSVEENIALQMRLAGRFDSRRIDGVLDGVGLAERRRARPSELSGGETARAGLAVALANEPRVLIADEPTGEVDAATESAIIDLFEARRVAGAATLIATHSQEVASHADRVVRLLDGRVIDA